MVEFSRKGSINMTFPDLLKLLASRQVSDLHLPAGLPPAIRVPGQFLPLTELERLTPDTSKAMIYDRQSEQLKACLTTAKNLL